VPVVHGDHGATAQDDGPAVTEAVGPLPTHQTTIVQLLAGFLAALTVWSSKDCSRQLERVLTSAICAGGLSCSTLNWTCTSDGVALSTRASSAQQRQEFAAKSRAGA
jgi:hypothetical protein